MAGEFLTTRWSPVPAAGGDDTLAGAALEQLCGDVRRELIRAELAQPVGSSEALAVEMAALRAALV